MADQPMHEDKQGTTSGQPFPWLHGVPLQMDAELRRLQRLRQAVDKLEPTGKARTGVTTLGCLVAGIVAVVLLPMVRSLAKSAGFRPGTTLTVVELVVFAGVLVGVMWIVDLWGTRYSRRLKEKKQAKARTSLSIAIEHFCRQFALPEQPVRAACSSTAAFSALQGEVRHRLTTLAAEADDPTTPPPLPQVLREPTTVNLHRKRMPLNFVGGGGSIFVFELDLEAAVSRLIDDPATDSSVNRWPVTDAALATGAPPKAVEAIGWAHSAGLLNERPTAWLKLGQQSVNHNTRHPPIGCAMYALAPVLLAVYLLLGLILFSLGAPLIGIAWLCEISPAFRRWISETFRLESLGKRIVVGVFIYLLGSTTILFGAAYYLLKGLKGTLMPSANWVFATATRFVCYEDRAGKVSAIPRDWPFFGTRAGRRVRGFFITGYAEENGSPSCTVCALSLPREWADEHSLRIETPPRNQVLLATAKSLFFPPK